MKDQLTISGKWLVVLPSKAVEHMPCNPDVVGLTPRAFIPLCIPCHGVTILNGKTDIVGVDCCHYRYHHSHLENLRQW